MVFLSFSSHIWAPPPRSPTGKGKQTHAFWGEGLFLRLEEGRVAGTVWAAPGMRGLRRGRSTEEGIDGSHNLA